MVCEDLDTHTGGPGGRRQERAAVWVTWDGAELPSREVLGSPWAAPAVSGGGERGGAAGPGGLPATCALGWTAVGRRVCACRLLGVVLA